MSEDGMMYTGNMATLDIEKCNCDFMQNTPKTIEDRIKELREITIKIEDLINTRILNKYLGLKTIKQEVAKDNLSEKFNIKLQELLSEQDRISRESERERISKRLDKLTRYGTTIHTTPPNFWAYKCEDVEDLLQTNKE